MSRLQLLFHLTNVCLIVFPISTSYALSNLASIKAATSRHQFLSSSAASFLAAATIIDHPKPSFGATMTSKNKEKNPRYLDSELEMKYAEDGNGNPRKRGVLVRRYTGDSTPYEFPIRPVRLVKEWPKSDDPEATPFAASDFFRADQQFDGSFYAVPRFVYHIDEGAVASLTQYYRKNIPKNSRILDVCSSWVSHYPLEFPSNMKRISATGMNKLELVANDQLTDYVARDLNENPVLTEYENDSFDVVTIVVSIDYLIHPIEVLREVHRVLRPGGKVIISQSNRCFPSKAIAMWLKMNDRQHLELINGYFQYATGFKPRNAYDITATGPKDHFDPMFIVEAIKE